MRRSPFVYLLVACVVLVLSATLVTAKEKEPPAGSTGTVSIDCTHANPAMHDNVQSAIDADRSETLTVEIAGMCQQEVVIRRDNVTLIGTDNTTDGFTGPGVGANSLVLVDGAQNVVIERLKITASEEHGLRVIKNALVFVNHGRAVDNIQAGPDIYSRGIHVGQHGILQFNDSEVSGNVSYQVAVFSGSFTASNSTIGNGTETWRGINTGFGASVRLFNTPVSVNYSEAVKLEGGSQLYSNSDISANMRAVTAYRDSHADLNGGTVTGALWAFSSRMILNDVTQASNPRWNWAHDDSYFLVSGATTLSGDTWFYNFSRGTAETDLGGEPSLGNLICDAGGDFYCGNESKTGSTCSQCE